MPRIRVVFYKDDDGSVPVLEWLRGQKPKARDKGRKWLGLLADLGHEVRRPIADYLAHDIYELRWSLNHVQYRILFFFDGETAAVLAHSITKEDIIPPADLNRAIERKKKYHASRKKHTYEKEFPQDQ